MKVAFIAVNYNNYNISINNVTNILSLKGDAEREVYIVDNYSEEEDRDSLKEGFPDDPHAHMLFSDKNLGYFGGLNYGIDAIDASLFDYVIVANNDLIYKFDFLEKLKDAQYDPDCLVVAPELITLDGKFQNPQKIEKPSRMRRLSYRINYSNYYVSLAMEWLYSRTYRKKYKSTVRIHEKKNIYQLTGACIILTKEFIRRCGRLDDSVFMWGEEMLLTHQVQQNSGVITYDPSLYILHMESASVKKIPSKKGFEMRKKSYQVYKDYYL